MKQSFRPALIAVSALLILALTACGKSEFSCSENTGRLMTVTAENAEKGAFFTTGSLQSDEGDRIVIDANLEKGSVRVEIIAVPEEQSIDVIPDMDGAPIIAVELHGSESAAGTVPAGSYLMKATCLEKATGTVRVAVASSEIANPWREITEAEAKEYCPQSFRVPEGAQNVRWSVSESVTDPAGASGALVQLSFDLDGNSFTAREQVTGEQESYQHGMYFDWTVITDGVMKNCPFTYYRWIGESGYADLCTWYDAEAGTSYSVSVTAEDLDGFDLQAIAEAISA